MSLKHFPWLDKSVSCGLSLISLNSYYYFSPSNVQRAEEINLSARLEGKQYSVCWFVFLLVSWLIQVIPHKETFSYLSTVVYTRGSQLNVLRITRRKCAFLKSSRVMLIPLVRGAPLVNFQFTSNMKESLDIERETALKLSSGGKVYFYSNWFCIYCCLKFWWDCGGCWLVEGREHFGWRWGAFFNSCFFLIFKKLWITFKDYFLSAIITKYWLHSLVLYNISL